MRLYGKYYSALTGEKERAYKPHEAQSLYDFVNYAIKNGAQLCDFDGYFYGYIIPRIGKEFDVLKIGKDHVLNVELKSWVGDKEQVLEQLLKNKFYLSHLDLKKSYFTFNSDTSTLYKLSEDNKLEVACVGELISVMKEIACDSEHDLDEIFEVAQFVLSPSENPERFINGEYFLTQQQQQIKKRALEGLEKNKFIKIAGSPGTGKTLLLYELATTLATNAKVGFLQPGNISDGQRKIERAFKNLTFIECDNQLADLSDYQYLLIDEAERMPEREFNAFLYAVKRAPIKCILAFEKIDVVGVNERNVSVSRASKIKGISFALSGKIRINSAISCFIQCLFDASKAIKHNDYNDVNVLYSNSKKQTDEYVIYLKEKGFVNIASKYELTCKREKQRGDLTLNQSYGREYDNVSVLIGEEFGYNEKGKLCVCPQNAFAENLYYAINRVRRNLCVIIENNEEVFERAITVKRSKAGKKEN